jgi:hypothetical protein
MFLLSIKPSHLAGTVCITARNMLRLARRNVDDAWVASFWQIHHGRSLFARAIDNAFVVYIYDVLDFFISLGRLLVLWERGRS